MATLFSRNVQDNYLMKAIKKLKITLTIVFILLSIVGLAAYVFWIWMRAVGTGFGGGHIGDFELFWTSKGLILIAIYSIIAGIGLRKPKRFGIIFGHATSLAIAIYLFTIVLSSAIHEISIEQATGLMEYTYWLVVTLLAIVIPSIMIIGLAKLRAGFFTFKILDSIMSLVLTVPLYLSLYYMFK
ncbi:MAG: hypothetical protein ACI8XB_000884 [Patiriisocius sp.]|jgi:hypothetical protein